MNLENTIYMSDLFSQYKELLTLKQREVCEAFYINNFGLSEIAENLGITRQAVLDTIKKTSSQLKNFENKLKLNAKFCEVLNLVKDEKLKEKISEILNK